MEAATAHSQCNFSATSALSWHEDGYIMSSSSPTDGACGHLWNTRDLDNGDDEGDAYAGTLRLILFGTPTWSILS